MLKINTIHITLQYAHNNEWPVLSVLKSADQTVSSKWVKTTLKLPRDWTEQLLKAESDPENYGTQLGQALFHSGLDKLIQAAITSSENTRLLLVVEPLELRVLHWERLYFPDGANTWLSLAQNQSLIFSYYTAASVKRYYSYLLRRHLKALFFICSPTQDEFLGSQGFTAFDTLPIVESIQKSLGALSHKILYQAQDTSWRNLQNELNKNAYALVHIISHGIYVAGNKQSYLILLDDKQKIRAVSAEEFVEKLQVISPLPHLLFFSSCNTADPAAQKNAHGNFAQVVRDKLATPAVIAMTGTVTQETANIVSKEFYEHLYQCAFADLALAKAGHKLLGTFEYRERHDRYFPVLYQGLGNGALFGLEPKGLDDLDDKEISDGLERLKQTLNQRAPKAVLEFEALAQQAQLKKNLEQLDQFCYEVTDISFAILAQNQTEQVLPAYNDSCPFPGMRPFKLDLSQGADYRQYFFGRDEDTEFICQKLKEPERYIFAIIGPSGSGKSSLAFAGVLKKLADENPQLQIKSLRPYFQTSTGQIESANQYLTQSLEELNTTQACLLYIDQFEEVFTAYSKAESEAFIQHLFALAKSYQQLKIFFTIRADYAYEVAYKNSLLKPIIDEHYYLHPLQGNDLRAVMEQQVDSVGLEFEKGLAHRILSDGVIDEPGAMPLLQHLLWMLWQYRHGRHLRIKDYEAIGGVAQAIAKTADELFLKYAREAETQQADSRQMKQPANTELQFYLQNIFLRLTRPDANELQRLNEQYRDTRQRVLKSTFYPADINPSLIDELLKDLVDARLVVSYDHELEIAHEALITHWPKLRDWLKNRQLVEMRQELSSDSLSWYELASQKSKQAKERLKHSGSEIDSIYRQRDVKAIFLNSIEVEYLTACSKRDRQVESNKKNVYRFAVVMLVLFILNSVISYFALQQKNKVDDQLAMQHLQQGIELRDKPVSESDKAVHYFAKALDVVASRSLKASIDYAHADLGRLKQGLLSSLKHEGSVLGAFLYAHDSRLLTWSSDNNAYIWSFPAGEQLAVLAHEAEVLGASVFANQTKMLTWGTDGALHMWDANTGKKLMSLPINSDVQGAIVFAEDKKVLTWSTNRELGIWDLETGKALKKFRSENYIEGATLFAEDKQVLFWSKDGGFLQIWNLDSEGALSIPMYHQQVDNALLFANQTKVLSWGTSGMARVWDAKTGKPLTEPMLHDTPLVGASIFAQERKIMTWSEDGLLNIWDATTGQLLSSSSQYKGIGLGVSLFANDSKLITWGLDGTARVWNLDTGQLIGVPIRHESAILGAKVFAEDTRILTWSDDQTARIWDANTGEPVSQIMRHMAAINGAMLTANEQQVVTWSNDGLVTTWNIESDKFLTKTVAQQDSMFRDVQLFADGARLLTWDNGGDLQILDSRQHSKLVPIMQHQGDIRGATLFANEARLLSWSEDKTAQVWDTHNGKSLVQLKHSLPVWGAKLFANETRILTWDENTLRVWSVTTGQLLKETVVTDDVIVDGTLIADTGLILLWYWTRPAQIWDVGSGEKVGKPLTQAEIRGALALTNGSKVLTWGGVGTEAAVHIWDAKTGEKDTAWLRHDDSIRGVRFFANQTRLLTWSNNGKARIWSIKTNEEKILLHEKAINGALLFANDTRVLTWSEDGTARIWSVETGLAIARPLKVDQAVKGALILDNSRIVIWADNSARIWDAQTGYPITQALIHNHPISGVTVLAKQDRVLLWGGGSISTYTLPQVSSQVQLLNEFKQAIQSKNFIDEAGDFVFLNEEQWARCQAIYKPYEACNASERTDCSLRKIWWVLERFFYQGPKLEDCLDKT